MPKLKEMEITYEQIQQLVSQLDFGKKLDLIKEVIKEKNYRKNFYDFTEGLTKKYNIPKMNEEELDIFLHAKN